MMVTFVMRCDRSTSSGRAKYCHFFKGFTFDIYPLPNKRQKKVTAQLFGRVDFEKCIEEFPEALIVDVLKNGPSYKQIMMRVLKI
jgi:hypothetical protein